ncbi:hypothetical protein C8R48DRAFT_380425 [Suillus tomentosus]|nr:hypothetical protein C8R48DRAFT_380425 [Suillus tomentosus]
MFVLASELLRVTALMIFTGKDAKKAVHHTFEDLAKNNEYHLAFLRARGRKPTVRLMERGMFAEYRRQKCDKTNISMGLVKVSIVLSNETLKVRMRLLCNTL